MSCNQDDKCPRFQGISSTALRWALAQSGVAAVVQGCQPSGSSACQVLKVGLRDVCASFMFRDCQAG
jgi:hypothetical protein